MVLLEGDVEIRTPESKRAHPRSAWIVSWLGPIPCHSGDIEWYLRPWDGFIRLLESCRGRYRSMMKGQRYFEYTRQTCSRLQVPNL